MIYIITVLLILLLLQLKQNQNKMIEEIRKTGGMIMSKISEFAEKQNAHNEKIGVGIDNINTSLDGLTSDIQEMKDLIQKLQNSSGEISAEDQATLDQLEAKSDSAEKNVTAAADKAKALDALNPPIPPVIP